VIYVPSLIQGDEAAPAQAPECDWSHNPKMVNSPPLKDSEISDLIKKMSSGDSSALAALYNATSRILFGLITHVLGNRAAAEEALLDAYMQAWRKSATFLAEQENPIVWLLKIGRARAIERLRVSRLDLQRQASAGSAQKEPAGVSPSQESTAATERQAMARVALASLAPEQQKVIELACYSGLSCSEIALKTGLPLGAVRTRTRLGMIHLEERFRAVLETPQR
jgi:RNA polymerase sigma-70 factor, ECF subfamily